MLRNTLDPDPKYGVLAFFRKTFGLGKTTLVFDCFPYFQRSSQVKYNEQNLQKLNIQQYRDYQYERTQLIIYRERFAA